MKVNVKYFGLLLDITQEKEEQFSLGAMPISVRELIEKIEIKYPLISELNFIVAVNQSISSSDILLKNNDIIALLPPFAGG